MRVVCHSSLILFVLAMPLSGCVRTSKQEVPPSKEAKQSEAVRQPDPVVEGTALTGTEVTLHVEGMV